MLKDNLNIRSNAHIKLKRKPMFLHKMSRLKIQRYVNLFINNYLMINLGFFQTFIPFL